MSALRFVGGGGGRGRGAIEKPGAEARREARGGRTDRRTRVRRTPHPCAPQLLLAAVPAPPGAALRGGGVQRRAKPPPLRHRSAAPRPLLTHRCRSGEERREGGAHKSPALHPLMAKRGAKDGVGTPGRIPADEGPALGAGR